jgi:hypothetical protein
MYRALSIFRRMAKRLGAFSAKRQAGPASHGADRAGKPQRRAGARVAAQGNRSPMKWQLHGQAPQTPSNLM